METRAISIFGEWLQVICMKIENLDDESLQKGVWDFLYFV